MRDQLIDLGKVAAALVALAGLAALLGKVVRGVWRTVRKLGRMADEVLGDEERHGWGKRIASMEALSKSNAARLTGLEKTVGVVVDEVKPNGGSSLKDQITRIERATGAHQPEE